MNGKHRPNSLFEGPVDPRNVDFSEAIKKTKGQLDAATLRRLLEIQEIQQKVGIDQIGMCTRSESKNIPPCPGFGGVEEQGKIMEADPSIKFDSGFWVKVDTQSEE